MSKDAILHVRIDPETKSEAERVYRGLDTSLSEAVRIFARQSINAHGFPFRPMGPHGKGRMRAKGALHAYADKRLRESEREAWIRSLSENYARLNR